MHIWPTIIEITALKSAITLTVVFFFKYSNVLYHHVAKDPVKFFKFSQILENLFENIMAVKGFSPAGLVTKF